MSQGAAARRPRRDSRPSAQRARHVQVPCSHSAMRVPQARAPACCSGERHRLANASMQGGTQALSSPIRPSRASITACSGTGARRQPPAGSLAAGTCWKPGLQAHRHATGSRSGAAAAAPHHSKLAALLAIGIRLSAQAGPPLLSTHVIAVLGGHLWQEGDGVPPHVLRAHRQHLQQAVGEGVGGGHVVQPAATRVRSGSTGCGVCAGAQVWAALYS